MAGDRAKKRAGEEKGKAQGDLPPYLVDLAVDKEHAN
jgi:hypothetical protein